MAVKKNMQIRSFEDFRDVVYGFRLSRIILSALELDLFSVMGTGSWTISGLAKQLKASRRGVDILCRNLASVGLLIKWKERYTASRVASRYLNTHSADFRGAYLKLLQRQWEEWSALTKGIKTGRPANHDEPETPAYRKSFSWAMHQRSLQSAKQVAKQLTLTGAGSLLDLGGGPGTYAVQFLKQHRRLAGAVMDRPAALSVAKTVAKHNRVEQRMSFFPGNFLVEPIPGPFDVVWYSNVLHIYSPQENLAVFRKVKRALSSRGRFLIQDTFLERREGLEPLEANLFAVTMLLYTDTGNTYPLADVKSWLKKAGFLRTNVLRMKKGTGDWDGVILDARV